MLITARPETMQTTDNAEDAVLIVDVFLTLIYNYLQLG